jgi:transposase-like protein
MTRQDRDRDISDLRQVGVRRCEVARRFGLSASQVRRIELRYENPPPSPHASALLRKAIRAADDPHKPWPATDLVHALRLLPATRRVLLAYLDRTATERLTLLALMDLVLLDRGERTVNLQNSPLFRMTGVDEKGCSSAAKALTALDMGSKANALWRKRIASLQGRWRIVPPWNY